jgi:hypothetical protein
MPQGRPQGSVSLCPGTGRSLFAAVGGTKGVVLWAILEAGGRPGHAVPLNCAELARQTGLRQPHLNRARLDLVRDGVLRETAVGTYEPVVEPRRYDPAALIGGDELVGYCAGGCLDGEDVSGQETDRSSPPKSVYFERPKSVYPNGVGAQKASISEDGQDQKPSISADPAIWGIAKHTKNGLPRARGEDGEINTKPRRQFAGPREDAAAAASEPARGGGKPPYPDAHRPVTPGPHGPTDEQARAFFDALWDAFGCARLCDEWWEGRREFDPRAWWHALREVRGRGTKIRKLSYLRYPAGEWRETAPLPPSADPAAPPPGRHDPAPGQAESKDCEYCCGSGLVTVYHPRPDPARRIPAEAHAACVCPRGRVILASAGAIRLDFDDVLKGGVDWLPDRPERAERPPRPPRADGFSAARRLARKFAAD